MLPTDPLTGLLVLGLAVLAVTTALTAKSVSLPSRQRRGRVDEHRSLTPSTEHALRAARARAELHHAESVAAAPRPVRPLVPSGQIIDVPDGPTGLDRAAPSDDATAFARRVASTDPKIVAEVIRQWIRADSTEPPDPFR